MNRDYRNMSNDEIATVVGEIINTSYSGDEVRRRIRDELNHPHEIALMVYPCNSPTEREAWKLEGGFVMGSGELITGMMHGNNHWIIDL